MTQTRLIAHLIPEIRVHRFSLEVVDGPDAGLTWARDREEITIGTADGNDLQLKDGSVSRHHCSIQVRPKTFLLRDLDSTNGTFVGDMRVEAVHLVDGATIRIGFTRLRFSISREQVVRPLSPESQFGPLVGASAAMRQIFSIVPRVATSPSPLLLLGETGTGKSALARAIHEASDRRTQPLVVVDCAALPPSLIESELLGHERGSFTGADRTRRGAFEAAEGGTVFLDEVGELPLDMQPKLLRVIEEREIRRVGGNHPVQLRCRIIAATNRDLRQQVNRGSFRGDLFYRLATLTLRMPPLRERRDDIPLLVACFLRDLSRDGMAAPHAEALGRELARREWPGNVRELRGAVERAALLGDLPELEPAGAAVEESSEPGASPGESFRVAKERAVLEWEKAYLADLVNRHPGNLTHAARAVQMDRGYLRELIRRHRLGDGCRHRRRADPSSGVLRAIPPRHVRCTGLSLVTLAASRGGPMRLISSASTFVMLSALAACASEDEDVDQETSAVAEQGIAATADCDPTTLSGNELNKCNKARHREGKRLFESETFDGNGRTCETCHSKKTGTLSPRDVEKRARKAERTGKPDPLFQHDALDDDGGIDRLTEHATIAITLPLPWYVTLADDPSRREITVFRGVPTTKNTPALDSELMHDRRAPDLQAQALGAIEDHAQNGRAPSDLELDLIAEFQKSDERFFSSNDLLAYAEGGAAPTLPAGETESEQRGRLFFVDAPFQPPSKVGACALCHSGPMLNELSVFGAAVFQAPPGTRHGTVHVAERNLMENPVYRFIVDDGLGRITEVETPDPGVLLQQQHLPPPFILPPSFFTSFFKTPTLWGTKDTAPYFHDNASKSLEEVVEQYDFFFANDPFVAGQIELTDQDRADIVAYLKLL